MRPNKMAVALLFLPLLLIAPRPVAAPGIYELRVVVSQIAFPGQTLEIYVLSTVSGTLTDTRFSGRIFPPNYTRGQKPDSLTFEKIWTGIFRATYDLDTNSESGEYLVMVEGSNDASHATATATFKIDSQLEVMDRNLAQLLSKQTAVSNQTTTNLPLVTERMSVDSSLGLREGSLTAILLFVAIALLIANLGIQLRGPRLRLPKPRNSSQTDPT